MLNMSNNTLHEYFLIIDKTTKVIIFLFFVYNINKEFFDENIKESTVSSIEKLFFIINFFPNKWGNKIGYFNFEEVYELKNEDNIYASVNYMRFIYSHFHIIIKNKI